MNGSSSYKSDLRVSRLELFDPSESKVQEKLHYFINKISDSIYFQFGLSTWNSERRDKGRKCCSSTFVFDPSGRLVYYWSFIVSLAFLYNFWVRIYE